MDRTYRYSASQARNRVVHNTASQTADATQHISIFQEVGIQRRSRSRLTEFRVPRSADAPVPPFNYIS